jgi:hypothetical protein
MVFRVISFIWGIGSRNVSLLPEYHGGKPVKEIGRIDRQPRFLALIMRV